MVNGVRSFSVLCYWQGFQGCFAQIFGHWNFEKWTLKLRTGHWNFELGHWNFEKLSTILSVFLSRTLKLRKMDTETSKSYPQFWVFFHLGHWNFEKWTLKLRKIISETSNFSLSVCLKYYRHCEPWRSQGVAISWFNLLLFVFIISGNLKD